MARAHIRVFIILSSLRHEVDCELESPIRSAGPPLGPAVSLSGTQVFPDTYWIRAAVLRPQNGGHSIRALSPSTSHSLIAYAEPLIPSNSTAVLHASA